MKTYGIGTLVTCALLCACSAPPGEKTSGSSASADTSSSAFPLEGTYTVQDNSCFASLPVGTTVIVTSDRNGVQFDQVTTAYGDQLAISTQLQLYVGNSGEQQELGDGVVESDNEYSSGTSVFTATSSEANRAGEALHQYQQWVFTAVSGDISLQQFASVGTSMGTCQLAQAEESSLQGFARTLFDQGQ